jgi:hypothetical protein
LSRYKPHSGDRYEHHDHQSSASALIEDMTARKFGPASQRSHIESCERFAAYLKRSPATATPDDVRLFRLDLIESGLSIRLDLRAWRQGDAGRE